ncbi:hypothetical protein MNBD_ALPHA12-943 [hydrothermal vent metagenome]|uniref:Sugar-binding domain-containing protein n=1 Tax=hydrothermal vent metagenome TaxID=652676 RepID=A0A3B0TX98_9ZZZZ
MENNPANTPSRRDNLLANVAVLYYGEAMTQSDIAKRIGVSRASVVTYLREGRERGIVDIQINGRALASSSLAHDLRAKFDLVDVYVAHYEQERSALKQTSHVAAMAFLDIISPGDHIGVAWGETVKNIADQLPNVLIPGTFVTQIIGAMHSTRLFSAQACSIQIASRIGAECFTLHAPAILSSAELASSLRREPTIKAQLEHLDTLDVVLFSVGDCSKTTHLAAAGIVSPRDLSQARKKGAKGVVCSRFIDGNGKQLDLEINERLIAIEIATLENTAKKILVAASMAKFEAVKAALFGNLATHLVVSEQLAMALMESST